MLTTLAIQNYRSLREIRVPLKRLNLVTGANGSGKSNLYKALRLLAQTAQGGVVNALALEGGLDSSFWAGPENITKGMIRGETAIEPTVRQQVKRLKLGFASDEFSYLIELGLPAPDCTTLFCLDPQIKREAIWFGNKYRPASVLVERRGALVKSRAEKNKQAGWQTLNLHMQHGDSIFSELADPDRAPEILRLRDSIRAWRFYDHFRSDSDAPARKPQLGTRTPVLHHDGRDLASAIQTIFEIGDKEGFDHAVSDAFPGAHVHIEYESNGMLSLNFYQEGLLRPLKAGELSDGTLRYLLLVAALLTPRPPELMVLNEPETSLHPDLLPALSRLIAKASDLCQLWVVSHANRLINALNEFEHCNLIELDKQLGQTEIIGQDILSTPSWNWQQKG
ncbi:AAA family ATPase [Shewanella psychropiezotolerans]|uniref:AAA family ATPase n=1 Tax=Shewanella psychropiezotolerans TaxID=2593655 RepID=A0ABX5WUF9_9GAMM|nr:AAA family ATPase [Shewanella psychropiezotolerans]QDO82734.1 AAA family ATPase [Shewanella psychropiezotolerans]